MAADREMIKTLASSAPGTIIHRVFSWKSPSVSLGRSAHLLPGAKAELAASGIESVVRPTGGAALIHGPGLDISYSAGLTRARGGGAVDLVETGRMLAAPILAALKVHGIGGEFRDCAACGPAGESARQPLCFLQKTPFDILVGGRKVAAFALRRTGEVVFLHGSVLTGRTPQHMVDALIRAGIGTTPEWADALLGVGHVEIDPYHLQESIAASIQA